MIGPKSEPKESGYNSHSFNLFIYSIQCLLQKLQQSFLNPETAFKSEMLLFSEQLP